VGDLGLRALGSVVFAAGAVVLIAH
jgi:hypothetical protein